MQITIDTYKKICAVDALKSDDLVKLVEAAGEVFETFFDGGLWEGLDFSRYDMSGVRFQKAVVIDCIFRNGDLSEEAISSCRAFIGNKFISRASGRAHLLEDTVASSDVTGGIAVDDLIGLCRNYNPDTKSDLIRQAYDFSRLIHEGQFRKSGVPYFTHPVAVAAILTEQRLDDATIITALLHDTIEDTRATYGEIVAVFGEEIGELVDGVTRLTSLQLSGIEGQQPETSRRFFNAMNRDLRVLIVKLVDRLHNMRTIRSMKPEKQTQKAHETMEIFAPLAGRMGMHWIREELEDLSFKVLNPEARNSIMRRFVTLQKELGDVVHKITADVQRELEKAQIQADVFGRAKKPYSIWRKMQEKDLNRLSDIYNFQIICGNVEDCYKVLEVVQQHWLPIPELLEDFIREPKQNGYQAIHATNVGRDDKWVEVRVCTRDMYDVNLFGVATHWSYREGVRSKNPLAIDPSKWIPSLTDGFGADGRVKFPEASQLDWYSGRVVCITPRGDKIELPLGARALDFAYAIHTSMGNSTVSVKVDGIRVPLWSEIKSGQMIEVITADGQRPQASWLDIVATRRAKAAIRRSLREEDRQRFVRLGSEIARAAFAFVDREVTEEALRAIAAKLGLIDRIDLLARLGKAEITGSSIIELLRSSGEVGRGF